MSVLQTIGALAIGFVLGAAAGYAAGSKWRGRRRTLLALGAGALVVALLIDLTGYVAGRSAISNASIGLMAGLLTGIKYGGFPEIRVWEPASPSNDDAPQPEGHDAP